jgi:glutamyl-tRNA synthetase
MGSYRGRFAPSPTGDLHLGSAATALVTWLAARKVDGELVLRVEDIDTPRVVPGAAERQMADLHWLGLDWDEGPEVGGEHGPYRQSERFDRYQAALDRLSSQGLVYPCDCSRAEIARIASAPHAGEEGSRYPGTCRSLDRGKRTFRRPPALRLAVRSGEIALCDRWQGEVRQDVAASVGDFVLRRGDGVWAYQLAVVVDDLAMRVTEVVRGSDLLASTPRQAFLAELLGGDVPSFAHAPVVVAAGGERLAKRGGGATLGAQRAAGRSAEEVVCLLARTLGLIGQDDPRSALSTRDLLAQAELDRLVGRREVRLTADAHRPRGRSE